MTSIKKFNLFKSIERISLLLAIISLVGSLIYRLLDLNGFNSFLTIILSLSLYITIILISDKVKTKDIADTQEIIQDTKNKKLITFTHALFFILTLLSFILILRSRTSDSIISPWQNVSPGFFVILFLTSSALSYLIYLKSKYSLLGIIIFSFLINSIAIIIYKYGFGFDFFIHDATMDLIDKTGAVNPKPLYYLGQYSLIVVLHKIFQIPIFYLHLLLVPVLASTLLPLALSRHFQNRQIPLSIAGFIMLILMVLPLGIFFNTTPQNLAFLFLLLVIIRGMDAKSFFDFSFMYIFSLAAFFTQPIAGIPALILSIALTTPKINSINFKKIALPFVYTGTIFILPLAFIVLNKINHLGSGSSDNPQDKLSLIESIKNLSLKFPDSENIFLNTVYFFDKNALLLICFIIFYGVYLAIKKSNNKELKPYLYIATAFFISFFIMKNISFDFLIEYERSDYANRILFTSLLFFYPFVIVALNKAIENIGKKNLALRYIFSFSLCLLIPIFTYLNYPRLDSYHNSHGYSVGQDDINAVNYIENDAKENYIVLANQQTSVAALNEFGFNRYYKGSDSQEIFYYPIPTGGPMYSYFLEMVNKKPTRDTMQKAMELAGVNEAYFVINKYWWAFSKIIEEAKLEADSWHKINNGNIYIFKYSR